MFCSPWGSDHLFSSQTFSWKEPQLMLLMTAHNVIRKPWVHIEYRFKLWHYDSLWLCGPGSPPVPWCQMLDSTTSTLLLRPLPHTLGLPCASLIYVHIPQKLFHYLPKPGAGPPCSAPPEQHIHQPDPHPASASPGCCSHTLSLPGVCVCLRWTVPTTPVAHKKTVAANMRKIYGRELNIKQSSAHELDDLFHCLITVHEF